MEILKLHPDSNPLVTRIESGHPPAQSGLEDWKDKIKEASHLSFPSVRSYTVGWMLSPWFYSFVSKFAARGIFFQLGGHSVGKQIVNVPSFLVRVESQKHIDFALKSPFGGGRPGRVKRKNLAVRDLSIFEVFVGWDQSRTTARSVLEQIYLAFAPLLDKTPCNWVFLTVDHDELLSSGPSET
eukprot:2836778-Pyramimonas_sp.AAC.1